MEEQIREIIEYYTKEGEMISQEDLVNMLREIQDVKGCIPAAVQKQVAEVTKMKETFLAAVIKRYPSLKAENYRHEIQICVGAGCSAKGSYDLLNLRKSGKSGKEKYLREADFICGQAGV